jgi:epoxyqueuosine reductase
MRAGVGEHLFGCDDCQTVCPFNASTRSRDAAGTQTFEPLPLWSDLDEGALLSMDEPTWQTLSTGSPIKRAELVGMARNAAVVLGNRGDPGSRTALSLAARGHPSEVVRDAARWALDRLPRPAGA